MKVAANRGKRFFAALFFFAALGIVPAGCKGGVSQADLVGTWSEQVTAKPGDDMGSQLSQAMSEAFKVDLSLRADNTFSMSVVGMTSTGKWTLADNTLTLIYDKPNVLVPNNGTTLTMTVSDDGKTLDFKPPGASETKHLVKS